MKRSLLPKQEQLEEVKGLKTKVTHRLYWSEPVLREVFFGRTLVLLTQIINFQNAENRLEIKLPSSNPTNCCLS